MPFLRHAFSLRYCAMTVCAVVTVGFFALAFGAYTFNGFFLFLALAFAALFALGLRDLAQTKHAVLRTHPIVGHLRYLLEMARPEMRQYFFEDDKTGTPFSRDKRALVYQRAKMQLDKRPFGTEFEVYSEGFEFLRHSIAPRPLCREPFRVKIGESCRQPYSASIYNISAMSFGALSSNAIRALNAGARRGGFAHDTGEGGVSPYHLENGGDLIWEIGSGYFGCRLPGGEFSPEKFAERAGDPRIKMVELKISQGAKPGHGGVLPAAKVTPEISAIRGVPLGSDCVSPAAHSAFSTPLELVALIDRMRELSGGKPAGFKLCIGRPAEFLAIVKAMLETGSHPDFIVVDGKEGGTGAAPLEFMDHLGMPMRDGLNFVHNALVGAGLREKIRIGAAGKIVSAFDMARAFALGADWCNAARGFMFALGCIQSQSCHTDRCPTGVATQDANLGRGLVVADKATRVFNFHSATLETLAELTAAAGLDHPGDFRPAHFARRISPAEIRGFDELYPALAPGELVSGTLDPRFEKAWKAARPDSFAAA
ncbi:MAG: FMN-binding glutamate synthase family protein [Hyphomicrobiales bacterium]|nr:FMN-binding glutamate synthase family protein [Hyphomicrobiales bacterium]